MALNARILLFYCVFKSIHLFKLTLVVTIFLFFYQKLKQLFYVYRIHIVHLYLGQETFEKFNFDYPCIQILLVEIWKMTN